MQLFSRTLTACSRGVTAASSQRSLLRWRAISARINDQEPRLRSMTDAEIRKESLALRYQAKSGAAPDELIVPAYALVREAGHRTLGMRHYDVQLIGGIAMHDRSIAVMQTGEGKTLTSTLPMYLFALAGKGAHLATANDYLAQRDAETMRPLYELLGLKVGVLAPQAPANQRRAAYQCDVTYSTAKEFGFDFLRDRLLSRSMEEEPVDLLGDMLGLAAPAHRAQLVQRAPYFALIDEADSLLIDEARTPLIISSLPDEEQHAQVDLYHWAAEIAPKFSEGTDFDYDEKKKNVTLRGQGRRAVRNAKRPVSIRRFDMVDLYQHVEQAIKVDREFQRDRHYIIRDGEVVIVDEFTGRLSEGRRWRDGIHQAVEAKEGVDIGLPSGQAARVTIQDYFHRYPHLAGMTGTVANSGGELRRTYQLRSIEVPTHRPSQRVRLPDLVFGTAPARWAAVVREIQEINATGRPVLVGTRSIDKSEIISKLLQEDGIAHEVLNARHIQREAKIVEQAGRKGRVTIATNMAGRGTDIKLGPGVEELGGLHVICTELHDSARIDRQLIGRCGRQGDPGTFRQYLSLDDDILKAGLGLKRARKLAKLGENGGRFDHLRHIFIKAQAAVEAMHARGRQMLIYQEEQHKKIQRQMGLDPYLDAPS